MPRRLAIEREAVAVMADFRDAAAMLDPTHRPGHRDRNLARCRPQCGFQRIFREQVQDVGDEQFLMLLLMMAAQFDQRARGRCQRWQRRDQRRVDMRAIGPHLVQRRAGHHAPAIPRVALAFGFVIAVEQEGPMVVVETITSDGIAQDEGFEEPRRMRQMPFRGAGIGHRLNGRIGVAQRCGERQAKVADCGEPVEQPAVVPFDAGDLLRILSCHRRVPLSITGDAR